ncbi:MAG: hypothetical protein KME43_07705 [Myxacorys chilensis ATA2-1-KO14]|jgi:hypothetical protein|nr:hypothetical protein [Myxacorys chilensis ATA2-1-KO14]
MFVTNETTFATNETMFVTNDAMFVTNDAMFATNETMFVTNDAMFVTNDAMFEDIALICFGSMSNQHQFKELSPSISRSELCLIPLAQNATPKEPIKADFLLLVADSDRRVLR